MALTRVAVPTDADFTQQGNAVAAGAGGEWDARMSGALSPCSLVKQGSTYFLYYIAADGDRVSDGGPKNRALGVATSSDGISFTKHGSNPIITHLTGHATNEEEEGVFSAAVFHDGTEFVCVWGGMTAVSDTAVKIDIFKSTSADGLAFSNNTAGTAALILDQSDVNFAGQGPDNDETFPAALLKLGSTWWLYYQTKNIAADAWSYYVVSGADLDALAGADSKEFLHVSTNELGGEYRNLSIVQRGDSRHTLFPIGLNAGETSTKLRGWNLEAGLPGTPGGQIHALDLSDSQIAILFLDRAASTWFYYTHSRLTDTEPIVVHTAPMVLDPAHRYVSAA